MSRCQGKCCGIDGYGDFNTSTSWNRTREVLNATSGVTEIKTLSTPVSCCVMEGKFPNVVPTDKECAINLKPDISNYRQVRSWSSPI